MARRRGIKLAKGVRLNINKKGTSITFRHKGLFGRSRSNTISFGGGSRKHSSKRKASVKHSYTGNSAYQSRPKYEQPYSNKYSKGSIISFAIAGVFLISLVRGISSTSTVSNNMIRSVIVMLLLISGLTLLGIYLHKDYTKKRNAYLNKQNDEIDLKQDSNTDIINESDINTDIALQLYESQNGVGEVAPNIQCLINSCQNRQEVLLKAIQLCGDEPMTAKQLYIVSHCYVSLGAKYRQKAIEYLEKYISAGATWSGIQNSVINMGNYNVNQLEAHRASVYNCLGKALEGEYEFEKAEQAYLKAEVLEPYFATYSVNVANTYIKRNDLDKALQYLQAKCKSVYYTQNINNYQNLIDRALKDISEKIDSGYVYRPHNKKICAQ